MARHITPSGRNRRGVAQSSRMDRRGFIAGAGLALSGCRRGAVPLREVVAYVSVDQVHAEPLLKAFEAASGVRVLPLYDVEAAKTTGLVNRLIAESGRPRADLWWSGEFAQTIRLADRRVLAPGGVAGLSKLGARDGTWAGLAPRARVLLLRTDRSLALSRAWSLSDLADGPVAGPRIAMARPLFGTAATHAAALFVTWGRDRTMAWFRRLRNRGVRFVDGNSVVRDMVARGEVDLGLTDSDDACGAVGQGRPVRAVWPDQNGQGTLLIPGSVALIAGRPANEGARALAAWLLSAQAEAMLVKSGFCQAPQLNPGLRGGLDLPTPKALAVDSAAVGSQMEPALAELGPLFVQ